MNKSVLHSIEIAGFRAYLRPQKIDLKGNNLAIFAPNGHGKSSIADAIEFYLANATTLPRLGERAAGNQAGPTALAHYAAAPNGIIPSVTLKFKSADGIAGEQRLANGRQPRTVAGDRIASRHKVDPIIRGYSLRSFVENTKPEERYTLISEWLSLSQLVEAQKAIRSLRNQLSTDINDQSTRNRVDKQLAQLTSSAVSSWNTDEIASWFRTNFLENLGLADRAIELDKSSNLISSLRVLVSGGDAATSLLALKQSILKLETVLASLDSFQEAFSDTCKAFATEEAERSSAANSTFNEVWKAVSPLLTSANEELIACPVCDTAWEDTRLGSLEKISLHVGVCLASLRAYEVANARRLQAQHQLVLVRNELCRALDDCATCLSSKYEGFSAADVELSSFLGKWEFEHGAIDFEQFRLWANTVRQDLAADVAAAQQRQDDQTPSKALSIIGILVDLAAEVLADNRQRDELAKIATQIESQGTYVAAEIRRHIGELLDELRSGTNDIYRAIQGDAAALIKLDLPKEQDKTQNRLNITIDFAPNRKSVAPGGYLSDSQLHSVALSFRLAAITRFNILAPFVVLDDVATSYDADYRRRLVAVVGAKLDGCQLIVLTHDQRFFSYMREMLPSAEWDFKQITALDTDFGPRLSNHFIKDAEIERLWSEGQSAANLMRQAEDEALLRWAQDFGVNVRIRPTAKPFDYSRAELAHALASYLKSIRLAPPLIPGVANAFLSSLQDGNVENFGSHFQDGPWGDGSIGDEKVRWEEFKVFRSAFVCPSCSGKRFKRPFNMHFPVCAKSECETQFRFRSL